MRTVTALYQTKAQAEHARDALKAAHLGDHVDIHDHTGSDAKGADGHGGFLARLTELFGGHDDRHVYGEGLRRGHFLLTAKVDELKEIRAAEILDATAAVDLEDAQASWRADGWSAPPPASPSPGADAAIDPAGDRVRVYPQGD